jgi:hypothetical protein
MSFRARITKNVNPTSPNEPAARGFLSVAAMIATTTQRNSNARKRGTIIFMSPIVPRQPYAITRLAKNPTTRRTSAVSDRRAESLKIGGDKIPFELCSEAAVWPIEIAEHAACAQGWTPSVRISQESNLLAIPKNDPDHRHVADVGSQSH